MSTFAAITCSSVRSDVPLAALRENFVRRGSTAWIRPLPSSGRAATATQSPTAGSSPEPASRTKPAGQLAAELAVLGEDDPFAAVLDADAAGGEACFVVRLERVREGRVPAQCFEVQCKIS